MKVKKLYDRKMLKKWQGIRDSDTKLIDMGYLYFYTNKEKTESVGICMRGVKNRKEAIEKYYDYIQ